MSTFTKEKKVGEVDSAAGEISSVELAQRVAVLRRFKTLLTQQRDRFRSYLDLLDKQHIVIESGTAEDLLSYVELEEKIVADIFSIQKVIDPLEEMYNTITVKKPLRLSDAKENGQSDEVPSLKASLENLKNEAVIRSTKNKELLSKRMVELRSEIKELRNNPFVMSNKRSSYGSASTHSTFRLEG